MTGKKLSGLAVYLPIQDILGRELKDEAEGFEFVMTTYREITQTKSRTSLLAECHPAGELRSRALSDAKRLGFVDGTKVRVVSKTNPKGEWDLGNGMTKPMIGAVKVVEGLRPGVVTFSRSRSLGGRSLGRRDRRKSRQVRPSPGNGSPRQRRDAAR